MWARPSIWVATLSLMNRAAECQKTLSAFFEAGGASGSFIRSMPSGLRNVMISPGLWPGHLKLRRL